MKLSQKQSYEAEFWTFNGTEIKVKKITFNLSAKYNSEMFYSTNSKNLKIDDPLKFAVKRISEKKNGNNLACVYGDPGTGKTTLMQNIALSVSSGGWKIVHLCAKTLSAVGFEEAFINTISQKSSKKVLFIIDDPDPMTSCALYDYYTDGIFSNFECDFLFLVSIPKQVYYIPRVGRALFCLTLGALPATVAAALTGNNQIRREMTLAKLLDEES